MGERMKWLGLALGIVASIGFVVFFVRSRGGEMKMSGELDRSLVQPYVKAVSAGQYSEAYALLGKEYRRKVSFEKFQSALEKRHAERGTLREARLLHDQVLRTLFSKKRTVRIYYRLDYPKAPEEVCVELEEDEKDHFAIVGTYRQGAGETLDFVVW